MRGLGEGAEVLLHVALRAVEPLLFAGPQGDADGAARLEVERLEDADGLHGDDGAGTVVGGSGAGDPAIEVAADHDDLVLELGIGAGDLGDGVEAVFVVAGELGLDVDFERDGHVGLGRREAIVVLDHHDGVGNLDGVLGLLRVAGEVGTVVVEDDAGAAAVAAIAGGRDDGDDAFIHEELHGLRAEALQACTLGEALRWSAGDGGGAAAARPSAVSISLSSSSV